MNLPMVIASPKNMEPKTVVKTVINGINIGGYTGPRLVTAHDSRLYLTAVANTPCIIVGVYVCFYINFIKNE